MLIRWRSIPAGRIVPLANSKASARLVLPAPAGPTSAMTRVPFGLSPGMRLSFLRVGGGAELRVERRALCNTESVGLSRARMQGAARSSRTAAAPYGGSP